MKVKIDLLPYDSESLCPKCGGDKVASIHEPKIENDPCWNDRKYGRGDVDWPEHEFIKRTCERCRYSWPQSVKP